MMPGREIRRDLSHHVTDIYVIEWLDRGLEPETGSSLFEKVLAPAAAEHPEITPHLVAVREPDELFGVLAAIQDEVRRSNGRVYPLIHIETHGNTLALGRVGGKKVSFMDLRPHLAAINEACRNHLVVTMAACWGEHAIQMMEPMERAPVFGIVGIDEDLPPELVADCFGRYCDTLVRTRKGEEAIKRMNEPLAGRKKQFNFIPAERMFREAWNRYAKFYCSPEFVQERIENMDPKLERGGPIIDAAGPIKRAEWMARKMVDDLPDQFVKARDNFFMYDLDPRNRDRFPVRYEEMDKPEGII